MTTTLKKLDITISVFNQEEIIERVLYGIFRNTTTPFNLVLLFDGCTDKTKSRALNYIKKVKPNLLLELITKDTPNLFELRANNECFKLAKTDYLITVQDDMVIKEYGWERRLTYPLRKFDDVLAVTARHAENISSLMNEKEQYNDSVAHELNNLPRNVFAVRDSINRGPIAFRIDYLKKLNYLNEDYAPCALDDMEISLRAWVKYKWKVGAFWIDYYSKKEWSKVSAKDSTMKTWQTRDRNRIQIHKDFKEYLDSKIKHNENIKIEEKEIDYMFQKELISNKISWIPKYPLRIDKRAIRVKINIQKRKFIEIIKKQLVNFLSIFLGKMIDKDNLLINFKKTIFSLNKKRSGKPDRHQTFP